MLENEGATPEELATKETEVKIEPKSMDDTIRETLRELTAKGVATDEVLKEEPKEKVRDEQGKFTKEELVKDAPKVGEMPTEPVKVAPNTWRKEVADKWATLPAEVQAEVEKREADFHKGIEQYKSKAQFADAMEKAITPYAATIQSLGITPDKAIAELMAADHRLRYSSPQDKQAYFMQLAQSYGIDLGNLQQAPQTPIDPNVSAMQQRVQQLEGWIQQQNMMSKQQEEAALNNEVAKFAADPSHSHLETVRPQMIELLQAGIASSLQDAYEQALWRNPTTRSALIAEQQSAIKEEVTKKAIEAKKAASVNVKARPSMPVSQPIGSMDDTIRQTLRRLQNA